MTYGAERAELVRNRRVKAMYELSGSDSQEHRHWFALLTRSRAEKNVASMLDRLGIRHFLPLTSEVHRWSDRLKTVSVPLFPSYLFVQVSRELQAQLIVLKLPGVVTFVGNQTGPQEIPQSEIDAIHTVLSRNVPCAPCVTPEAGARVRIRSGVLAGIEGTLVRSGADTSLVISVESIRQSISIHVNSSDVEPVCDPSHPARSLISASGPLQHLC